MIYKSFWETDMDKKQACNIWDDRDSVMGEP